MALIIEQGPLPDDFDRLFKAIELEVWVNNTTIVNIDNTSFDLDVTAVASQTDQPDTKRGLFWFKRGEGHLFFQDDPDRGDTRYTGSPLVSIAPNREMVVQIDGGGETVTLGACCHMAHGLQAAHLDRFYQDFTGRQTSFISPVVDVTNATEGRISNWCLFIQDTPKKNFEARGLEWGYGIGLMASGVSSVAGTFLKSPTDADSVDGFFESGKDNSLLHCRNTDVSEQGLRIFGLCVFTSGVTEPHQLQVFKRATSNVSWYR